MSDLWIIYGVVFAAVILTVQALYWLIVGAQRRGATLKRRLALSAAGRAAMSQPVDILRQERGLANFDHPRFASLNEFLAQTGLRISVLALGLWAASFGAAVGVAFSPFLSHLWAAAAVGLVAGPLGVVLYLSIVRRRRIDRFTAQLPDALNIIVRSLRIGHPFVSAIRTRLEGNARPHRGRARDHRRGNWVRPGRYDGCRQSSSPRRPG